MTIQELRDFLENSDYSSDTKIKALAVLGEQGELTKGLLTEIKSILQSEIESDIVDAGVDLSSEPEMQDLQKEHDEMLEKIEQELENDMNFVERELKDIDEAHQQISQIADDIEAEEIKQNIVSAQE